MCAQRNETMSQIGVGLKAPHYRDVLESDHSIGWFEVHPENYMGEGGLPHFFLERVREHWPVSLHGVGLSLGSADGLDENHLQRLKAVADRYEPFLISEHLSWSIMKGAYLNDLLPLPLTEESLSLVAAHVDHMQDVLGRQILVENPSTYLTFAHSPISEPEFLNFLAARTGCGLLLDVNNVYVSAHNAGWDAQTYLDAIDPGHVGEIHLAGHARRDIENGSLLIDDHGAAVCPDVWALYERLMHRIGPRPTLIERDNNIPGFADLEAEAGNAARLMTGFLKDTSEEVCA